MGRSSRLVERPVFILSPIRSGSTLLRCILDTHSEVCAPHELHLGQIRVNLGSWHARLAMQTAEVSDDELDFLLWDRILHRFLTRSGKRVIVDKTPQNLWCWRRLASCWPEARFIFLLRHPAHLLASAIQVDPSRASEVTTDLVLRMFDAMEDARRTLTGLTVRYERLTAEPERVLPDVCAHLGVAWEPAMLDYGRAEHGPLVAGIGDFGEKIRAGRIVHSGRSTPATEMPDGVRQWCRRWAYDVA